MLRAARGVMLLALPMESLPWLLVLAVIVYAVDAAFRRLHVYDDTAAAWPARWRPRQVRFGDRALPYRAAEGVARDVVVPAGIARAVSVWVVPVAFLAFMWTVAAGLGVCDYGDVIKGRRTFARVTASLVLCAVRAVAGYASVGSAVGCNARAFAASSALALALDGALFAWPLPCSDDRSDDLAVAALGLTVQGLFAAGFGWSWWRRRGLLDAPTLDPRVDEVDVQ